MWDNSGKDETLGDLVETLPYFIAPQSSLRNDRPVPAVLSHAAKLVFLGYAAFIAYESLVPAGAVQSIRHLDKLVHAGAYFVFAAMLAIALPRVSLKFIFMAAFLFGAALELAQGTLTDGRTASVGDLIANGTGAGLAMGLCIIAVKLMRSRQI